MTRPGSLPQVLRAALGATGTRCFRHCDRPAVGRVMSSPLPGRWSVYACPSGVVSVTSYAEWSNRDPTPQALSFLRRRTVPPSLVRPRDLRLATRHGPELGRAAERAMASRRPSTDVRVVYWRVYPFPARDGREQRLFVCRRKLHARPVFYAGPAEARGARCPVCATESTTRRSRVA